MTLEEKLQIENEIEELKNCIVVYKNGKRKVVKVIDLPLQYQGETLTFEEIINRLNNELNEKQSQIDLANKKINKLHEIIVKLTKTMVDLNKSNNVQTANLQQAISELGGNI